MRFCIQVLLIVFQYRPCAPFLEFKTLHYGDQVFVSNALKIANGMFTGLLIRLFHDFVN